MDATTAPPTTDFRRALSRWLFRGVTLVGLGLGMWLLNQGAAAADEAPPAGPLGIGSTLSGLTGSVTDLVDVLVPAPAAVGTPATPAPAPIAAAVPPPASSASPVPHPAPGPAPSPAAGPAPSQGGPLGSVVDPLANPLGSVVDPLANPLGQVDAVLGQLAAAIDSMALHSVAVDLVNSIQTVTTEVVTGARTAVHCVLDRSTGCAAEILADADELLVQGFPADATPTSAPRTSAAPGTAASAAVLASQGQLSTSTAGASDRTAADSLAASGPMLSSQSTRVPGPAIPAPTPANVPTGDPGGQRSIGQVSAAFAANTSSHGDTGSGATAMSALVGPSPAPAHRPTVSPD